MRAATTFHLNLPVLAIVVLAGLAQDALGQTPSPLLSTTGTVAHHQVNDALPQLAFPGPGLPN